MVVILVNVMTILIETNDTLTSDYTHRISTYHLIDLFFLSAYLFEFIIKTYLHPISYWKNGYTRLEFTILLLSVTEFLLGFTSIAVSSPGLIGILKAFRSIRIFKIVSVIKSLQILVSALITTITTNAVNILALLFLVMFIFGVLGHYLFGADGSAATTKVWGTFGNSFYMLLVYTCVNSFFLLG